MPEEVPPQAPSQIRPTFHEYGSLSSLTPGRKLCGSKGKKYERGPRRAAERKEGPKVDQGPGGGCPFRVWPAGRILPLKKSKCPRDPWAAQEFPHPWTLPRIRRIDRGRFEHSIEGDAPKIGAKLEGPGRAPTAATVR